MLERQHGDDRLDAAGGAQEVAGHRLGRRHGEPARVLAEHPLDRQGLGLVVVRRRGAVGVDVADVLGPRARRPSAPPHGAHGAVALRIGRGHVVGVGRHAVADDLRVDARAAPARVLERSPARRCPPPSPRHEAVAVGVERPRGPLRLVVARGQRLHLRRSRRCVSGVDDGLGAAGDHHVGVAALDDLERVADRVVAGRAGGDHRGVRPLQRRSAWRRCPDAMLTMSVGMKNGRDPARAPSRGAPGATRGGEDAADPGADEDADARRRRPWRSRARRPRRPSTPAASAYWMNRSSFLSSFFSMHFSGSKPLTSPAIRASSRLGSNRVIGPTPDRPSQTARQYSGDRVAHRRHRPEPGHDDPCLAAVRSHRPPPASLAPRTPGVLGVLLDVLDRVADRRDLLGVLVGDLDVELLLERHHELHRVQGVGAEILDELRRRGRRRPPRRRAARR